VARAEAYLRAKFHLDPSNRLATIHQRYRQDRQADRRDSVVRHVTKSAPVGFFVLNVIFFAFLNLFGVIILEIGGVQIFLPLPPLGVAYCEPAKMPRCICFTSHSILTYVSLMSSS